MFPPLTGAVAAMMPRPLLASFGGLTEFGVDVRYSPFSAAADDSSRYWTRTHAREEALDGSASVSWVALAGWCRMTPRAWHSESRN